MEQRCHWASVIAMPRSLCQPNLEDVERQKEAVKQHPERMRELNLEYGILYPAELRVVVDGKPLLFSDQKQLKQFLKRIVATGEHRNSPALAT
ncbi:hypothetical protein NDU88_010908 [Pleurodeles waltl]|uniref:Iodothyronine deiodinase n=1 Tax=Pleurodeles waltl TaxID=8319 RepID=A0AAV7QZI3_PLEWA|nr:hypothetical protein NDU88_010908 [Pleurodeles waltl]